MRRQVGAFADEIQTGTRLQGAVGPKDIRGAAAIQIAVQLIGTDVDAQIMIRAVGLLSQGGVVITEYDLERGGIVLFQVLNKVFQGVAAVLNAVKVIVYLIAIGIV